jgi:hypothetical protein
MLWGDVDSAASASVDTPADVTEVVFALNRKPIKKPALIGRPFLHQLFFLVIFKFSQP